MNLSKLLRKVDIGLVVGILGLCGFGLLMIYSATFGMEKETGDVFFFFKRQLSWIILGLTAMVLLIFFDYTRLRGYIFPIYITVVFLLLLVLFVGGKEVGAQRWISIGAFQLQPSEFTKVALIVCLAGILSARDEDVPTYKRLLYLFGLLSLPLFLVFLQPDLGTALVLLIILMGILLASGISWRYYIAIVLAGVILCLIILQVGVLKDYQIKRLVVFINPDIDPLGAGYNLLQSKIAIGSGRLAGKGLFSGTQTNLNFLPTRHTDFIFSVVGEELGFLGAALLLGLFSLVVWRGIRVAALSRNLFGALVAIGVITMWAFQILVNVGMTMGIMPITGIPLPFVSYGGSAMLANLLSAGLLFNIYAHRLK